MSNKYPRASAAIAVSLAIHGAVAALALTYGKPANPPVVTIELALPIGAADSPKEVRTSEALKRSPAEPRSIPPPRTEQKSPTLNRAVQSRAAARTSSLAIRDKVFPQSAPSSALPTHKAESAPRPTETVRAEPEERPKQTVPTAAPADRSGIPQGTGTHEGVWKELNLHSVEDYEWAAYLAHIRERIRRHFADYPHAEFERGTSGRLEVKFGIERNGALAFVTVMQTSGSEGLDAYAVEAVRKAAPFLPIPQQNLPGINLKADFSYVIRNAGGSKSTRQ